MVARIIITMRVRGSGYSALLNSTLATVQGSLTRSRSVIPSPKISVRVGGRRPTGDLEDSLGRVVRERARARARAYLFHFLPLRRYVAATAGPIISARPPRDHGTDPAGVIRNKGSAGCCATSPLDVFLSLSWKRDGSSDNLSFAPLGLFLAMIPK